MDLVLAISVMALVTYIPRVMPLLLMKKPIKSRFIQSFLYYIPYTVLAAMTFPVIFDSTGNLISGIVGAAIAIGVAYLGGSLVQVSIVTVIAVYITNML